MNSDQISRMAYVAKQMKWTPNSQGEGSQASLHGHKIKRMVRERGIGFDALLRKDEEKSGSCYFSSLGSAARYKARWTNVNGDSQGHRDSSPILRKEEQSRSFILFLSIYFVFVVVVVVVVNSTTYDPITIPISKRYVELRLELVSNQATLKPVVPGAIGQHSDNKTCHH